MNWILLQYFSPMKIWICEGILTFLALWYTYVQVKRQQLYFIFLFWLTEEVNIISWTCFDIKAS